MKVKWNSSNETYNPCKPDCPNRSLECHGTCKEYLEYRKRIRKIHIKEANDRKRTL